MKTEGCRDWRESLGAYALGHLPPRSGPALEAHLEGCPECRAEAGLAGRRRRAAAARRPGALRRRRRSPPPDLGERIAGDDRRRAAGSSGAAGAGASASRLGGGRGRRGGGRWRSSSSRRRRQRRPRAARRVRLAAGRDARSTRRSSRTPTGPRSTCTSRASAPAPSAASSCAGRDGTRVPAGTFRYRWGDDSTRCSARRSTSPAPARSASAPATEPSSPRSTWPERRQGPPQTRRTRRDRTEPTLGAAGARRGAGDRRLRQQRRQTARRRRLRRQGKQRGTSDQRDREVAPGAESGAAVADRRHAPPKSAPILVDSKGFTVYDFHKDKGTTSSCYGACAEVWPPVTDRRRTAGRRRRQPRSWARPSAKTAPPR